MKIYFTDNAGTQQPIYPASYGIGITRVMGVVVEKMADEKGLVWPENIAPARVYLVRIGDEEATVKAADELYQELQESGVEVLYDDRDERPGKKFADADLMGIPHRLVVSKKTIDSNLFEYKARTEKESKNVSKKELLEILNIG